MSLLLYINSVSFDSTPPSSDPPWSITMTERLTWAEVARLLGRLSVTSSERVEGLVVDTAHFDAEGRVVSYLTSQDGVIIGLEESQFSDQNLLHRLVAQAVDMQGKYHQHVAIVARKSKSSMELMNAEEVQNLLKHYRNDIAYIRSYVPSKGHQLVYKTYRYFNDSALFCKTS